MFFKESKLIRYENKPERTIHDQGKKMVNNKDGMARDDGIRRQELLIKFYKSAQGIKRISRYNKEKIIT